MRRAGRAGADACSPVQRLSRQAVWGLVAYGTSIDSRVRGREREHAFAWCRHAANAGHVEAQYHLGMFYKSGIGTPEDRTEALRWYKVAAERGHQQAENEARGLQGMARVCRNAITGCRMF